MKRACPNQCKACPFRSTSLPGWLGSYTPELVVRALWAGVAFFCHSRTKYTRGWEERSERTGQLCVGFLLARDRFPGCPASPDPEIRAAEAQAKAKFYEHPEAYSVMAPPVFLAHHNMTPEERHAHVSAAVEAGQRFRM